LTAKGGSYRLCWCASGFSCSTAADMVIDMGELVVIGPSPLSHEHTCVSGQSCSLDGIIGNHLSNDDMVMVLATCGAATTIPGLPQGGTWASSTEVSASGASLAWRVSGLSWTDVTAPGGFYRLCWCAGGHVCSVPQNFVVDFGELTIVGPGR
jgi:hypothetical protein